MDGDHHVMSYEFHDFRAIIRLREYWPLLTRTSERQATDLRACGDPPSLLYQSLLGTGTVILEVRVRDSEQETLKRDIEGFPVHKVTLDQASILLRKVTCNAESLRSRASLRGLQLSLELSLGIWRGSSCVWGVLLTASWTSR